jgi:hypothetical protein
MADQNEEEFLQAVSETYDRIVEIAPDSDGTLCVCGWGASNPAAGGEK